VFFFLKGIKVSIAALGNGRRQILVSHNSTHYSIMSDTIIIADPTGS